jgi:hypothetical protein
MSTARPLVANFHVVLPSLGHLLFPVLLHFARRQPGWALFSPRRLEDTPMIQTSCQGLPTGARGPRPTPPYRRPASRDRDPSPDLDCRSERDAGTPTRQVAGLCKFPPVVRKNPAYTCHLRRKTSAP